MGVLADVSNRSPRALTGQFLVVAALLSPNGTRVINASWDVPTRPTASRSLLRSLLFRGAVKRLDTP